jgi:hypothetical protein
MKDQKKTDGGKNKLREIAGERVTSYAKPKVPGTRKI